MKLKLALLSLWNKLDYKKATRKWSVIPSLWLFITDVKILKKLDKITIDNILSKKSNYQMDFIIFIFLSLPIG